MADDELDYEVPDVTVPPDDSLNPDDLDMARKKAELLKMLTPPEPVVQPPQEVPQPPAQPQAPPFPVVPEPQTFLQRLIGATAPRNLPGAPLAVPIQPPQLPPKDEARIAQEAAKVEDQPAPGLQSTAGIREAGLKPGEETPSKDVNVTQRTDYIRRMREPLRQEIEADPKLKLRVAALLALENPGAGPAVVESLLNRSLYAGRPVSSMVAGGPNSFYGPARIPGLVERKMAEIEADPKQRDKLFALINEAYSSNVTKGHTDQGSAGDPNYTAGGTGVNINRERFNDWGGGPGGHAGARRFREELQRLAGQPYVPMNEIAQFLNPEPTATQKTDLSVGGRTDSPIAAAQTAALMTGTPIEKIKAISDVMRVAGYKGVTSGEPGQAPQKVKGVPQQAPVEGQLPQAGSVTHTYPNMFPTPGMPTPGAVPFAVQQLTNPTVLSTAASFLAQQPPPPITPAPTEGKPSFMDRLKTVYNTATAAAGADPNAAFDITKVGSKEDLDQAVKFLQSLGGQARQKIADTYQLPDITQPQNWTPDTASKLLSMARDVKSGAVDLATGTVRGSAAGIIQKLNIPAGIATGMLAAGAKLLGSDALKEGAIYGATTAMPFIEQLSKTVAGITPQNEGVGTEIGQFAGRNITGGPIGTAASAGMELTSPYMMDWLKKNAPEIPNINPVQTAQAADLTALKNGPYTIQPSGDGKHVIAQTAAGPVLMDDATLNALGWTGIATMGFMAAPSLIKNAYKSVAGAPPDTVRGKFSAVLGLNPERKLAGVPGSEGMVRSGVWDYWNASTLDHSSPLIDIYKRHYNALERNGQLGHNALTAAAVADQTHIYSNSGIRNFISNVMETGKMRTSTIQYDAPASMRQMHDFAMQTPEFKDFLRLKMLQDELRYNHQKLAESQLKGGPKSQAAAAARYKTDIQDINGDVLNVRTVSDAIGNIVAAKPEIAQAYKAYTDIIDATKHFAQDGSYARENFVKLNDATSHAPNTPAFAASRDITKLWEQARAGLDPLHILEREIGDTLAARMHNEVIGTYINGLPKNTHFREVDKEFFRTNTVDQNSVLKFKQDGVTHTYVADPMVIGMLTLEPAGFRGAMDATFKASKQGFQLTTTGPLATYFANTSAFRTWRQHFVTAPPWSSPVYGPGFVNEYARSFKEVPRQLTPQLAQAWKPAIDQVTNWLRGTKVRDVVGDQNLELMSRILTSETYNNFKRDYEAAGGRSQSWISQAEERRNYINKARNVARDPDFQNLLNYLERVTQPLSNMWIGDKALTYAVERAQKVANEKQALLKAGKMFWDANTQTFRNVADSPNMAWAFKNRNTIDPVTGAPITMEKLVAETRNLTGDPSRRGVGRFKPIGDQTGDMRLPFQVDTKLQQWGVRTAQGVGRQIVDPFHASIPWSGVMVNSLTSTIAAMANNPFRAATWLMLTQAGPEAAVYAWNRALGPEYVNYYMEGRSENSRRNWTYIGVPGKKPWEGIELPDYQEGYLFRHTPVMMLDQMYGRSPFTFKEEFKDLWTSAAANVLVPPLPSPFGAVMGYMGAVAPEGLAGDLRIPGARSPRELNKPDNHIELALRAMFPSIVDYWTQYYRAAHASEGGWEDQFKAGTAAMGRRAVERTPILRDIIGWKPPEVASSKIVEETYKRQKTINQLEQYYSRDYLAAIGMAKPARGRSKGGMKETEQNVDPNLIPQGKDLPGMPQPLPTNPLFEATAKTMEELFKKDSPQKGGHGYRTMWSIYSYYNKWLDSMRNVSEGNEQAWITRHANAEINPYERAKMQEAGIDQKNFRAVKDFYTNQRNLLVKEIFLYMRAAEQKINQMPEVRQMLGDKEFTLEMADPYKPGIKKPEGQ